MPHDSHDHDHGHSHGHSHAPHAHQHGHQHEHEHTHADGQVHAHPHRHEHAHEHHHEHAAHHLHQGGDAHAHDHTHDHEHSHETLGAGGLTRGAGFGRVLYLDAPSGLAGDMLLAALLDLGVPWHAVQAGLDGLGLDGYHVHLSRRERHAISGIHVDVHVDGAQPMRSYAQIRQLLLQSALAAGAKQLALRIFDCLAQAEAKVHHTSIDDVHFHEVGAVDSIVDTVGVAIAIDYLGAELRCSALPMGTGYVKAAHGQIPQPAPAVVSCLVDHATYGVPDAFEFVTPTGAAVVGALAKGGTLWPAGRTLAVGWGVGTADRAASPNVLRAVLIDTNEQEKPAQRVIEMSANVDDMTGEEVGELCERLREQGALDAWAVTGVGKKGRPVHIVHALCRHREQQTLTDAFFRHSRTLGIRYRDAERVELERELRIVHTPYGDIRVKVANWPGAPQRAKAEFDDCARAARLHGVTLAAVRAAAESAL